MQLFTFVLLAFAAVAVAKDGHGHKHEEVPILKEPCNCPPVICPSQLMNKKSVCLQSVCLQRTELETDKFFRYANAKTRPPKLAISRLRADAPNQSPMLDALNTRL
jgi:hypothetical protein